MLFRSAFQRGHHDLTDAIGTKSGTVNDGAGLRNNSWPASLGTEHFTGLAAGHRTHCRHITMFRYFVLFVYEKGDPVKVILYPAIYPESKLRINCNQSKLTVVYHPYSIIYI